MWVSAALALIAIPGILCAQWPDYAAAGIPRTPDGKPKLDAPAPRTADGHPDLSGIWNYVGRIGRGPGLGPPGALGPFREPETPEPATGPPAATFFNIGQGFQGGLPLTPFGADFLKQRMAQNSKDNPDAHCLPLGLMQLHTHSQPRKIIQSPNVTVILYEAQAGIRQVFTDGRPVPHDDPQPWWYGYSAGKWDGDVLVVETNGFRDDVWLDVNGSPLTNSGKMTERFRRPNFGNLEIDVTIEDPKVYTKPFTVRVNQKIMVGTDLIEFICTENDKAGPHLVGK